MVRKITLKYLYKQYGEQITVAPDAPGAVDVPEAGADTVTGTGSEPVQDTITVTFPDGNTPGTGTVGEDVTAGVSRWYQEVQN
ncbi:hypothetical protein KQ239_12320 [Staphylococcus haemolyticus]|uniref:hypothetical protein n=1 Tax=Staphylococcus haemolyticus TaxID=1283 RepID=UPI001CA5206C|nr:hypothetical protein [Staphylococcus haemolyticus]MBW5903549.1 hypothetical protein [Staphylococcus haemolyticus]